MSSINREKYTSVYYQVKNYQTLKTIAINFIVKKMKEQKLTYDNFDETLQSSIDKGINEFINITDISWVVSIIYGYFFTIENAIKSYEETYGNELLKLSSENLYYRRLAFHALNDDIQNNHLDEIENEIEVVTDEEKE